MVKTPPLVGEAKQLVLSSFLMRSLSIGWERYSLNLADICLVLKTVDVYSVYSVDQLTDHSRHMYTYVHCIIYIYISKSKLYYIPALCIC